MITDGDVVHRRRILTRRKRSRQHLLRVWTTDLVSLCVIVDAMSFASRLTEARTLRGLKQAQLARMAGLTGAWVSKAESGLTVDVQARALFSVSRALRVNPEWLAEGIGPRDLVPSALAAELADLSDDQQAVVRSVIQSIKK